MAQALAEIDGASEAFVIGGAAFTRIRYASCFTIPSDTSPREVEGDTVLTGFNEEEWHETNRQDFRAMKQIHTLQHLHTR